MRSRDDSDPYLARLNRYGKDLDNLGDDVRQLGRDFIDLKAQIVALSQANADLTRKVDMLMKRKQ